MTHKMKYPFVLFITLIGIGSLYGLSVEASTNADTLSRGWQLTLNQNLTIPGQSAGVYLQYGKIVDEAEKDQYYANCRLEVRDPHDEPQTVKADTFTVDRVKWTEDDVSLYTPQYASIHIISAGGATADAYTTTLYLHSDRQPDVTQLICKHWEDPTGFAEHLSVKQIRDTLGEIFTLQPGNE